jgi:hypothetical protein
MTGGDRLKGAHGAAERSGLRRVVKHELVESERGNGSGELIELIRGVDTRLGRHPEQDPADGRGILPFCCAGLVQLRHLL